MKKYLFCLIAMMAVCSAGAQRLILQQRFGTKWGQEMLSMKNKPNGFMYRMRVDKQSTDLPQVQATEGLELYISEPTDNGWLGFYRLPTSSDDYDFVVVLYDEDKQPTDVINLCDITNNRYCEVQDVRWDADNHWLLFNMACPSYADMIDGKGSKLYCYDPGKKRMVWETGYLVSNDIFILDDKYVYCSYGFTSEKKFLYLLDKKTGKTYSKLPMVYKVEYMELEEVNGHKMLYAVDYNDNLFSFRVSDKPEPAKKTTAKRNVRRK